MKRNKFIQFACSVAVAVSFAACSQDELSSPTGGVEGAYPLQIATVTIADGQPSTRVTENADRMGSMLEVGDLIYVKFEGQDEVCTLRITDATTGAVEVVDNQLYWTSAPTTISAWHNSTGQKDAMAVNNQKDGIVYLVGFSGQVEFSTSLNLTMTHQLSKVRVYLSGFTSPTSVAMKYPADYTITDGKITKISDRIGTISMCPTTVSGKACFEAAVAPGTVTSDYTFIIRQANGAEYEMGLNKDLVLEAGKVSEVTLTLRISN